MSGAYYDVIMLVRNMLISSVLVQSLILNQSKVFLAAQGFLSKQRVDETLLRRQNAYTYCLISYSCLPLDSPIQPDANIE